MNILDTNKKIVEARLYEIVYVDEVVLVQLREHIAFASRQYSSLLEVYKGQFYKAIVDGLSVQKSIFEYYKEDLENILKEYNEEMSQSDLLEFDVTHHSHEEKLINAIALITNLIKKFDIEIHKNSKELQNENNTTYEY